MSKYVSHSILTRDSNIRASAKGQTTDIDQGLCMNCDTYFAMNYSLRIKQAK